MNELTELGGIWVWVAAVVVGVLGAARLTRLIVHDAYPPMSALRRWWISRTWDEDKDQTGDWGLLATCHWCASPWVFALVMLSGWASSLHWTWWLFWGWLAGSYVIAMVVERDEKD
jgi:hypothetical protein